MPVDCHIHMALDGADWRASTRLHASGPQEALIRGRLAHYRDLGFSYLREGGDRWGAGLLAKRLAGEYGICLVSPAFPIYKKGYYGSFIGRGFETPDEYRALVAEAKAAGADFIKLMISGLMDFDRPGVLSCPGLEPELIRELIAVAHGEGFAVMAHANGARTVEAAARAGVDSVEHGAYLDRAALEAMAQAGTIWVPTLSTIGNLSGKGRYDQGAVEAILAGAMENVRTYAALGGQIAPGSDAGAWQVFHGQGGLDEYAYLRRALGPGGEALVDRGAAALRARFSPR